MTDRPNPDSPPRDDESTWIERAVEPETADNKKPVPDTGTGGAGGAEGIVKNQDDMAQ